MSSTRSLIWCDGSRLECFQRSSACETCCFSRNRTFFNGQGAILADIPAPNSGRCNRTQGGAEGLAEAGADKGWALPLGAAVLAVRHLGLSSWQQQECFALENELGAWQAAGNLTDPTNALRCTTVDQPLMMRCLSRGTAPNCSTLLRLCRASCLA